MSVTGGDPTLTRRVGVHLAFATPVGCLFARQARPKAATPQRPRQPVRHEQVDPAGKVTLFMSGHLYNVGIGRTTRAPVLSLVEDLDAQDVNADTGKLLRDLSIGASRVLPTPDTHETPELGARGFRVLADFTGVRGGT